jgi:hypothetical protein
VEDTEDDKNEEEYMNQSQVFATILRRNQNSLASAVDDITHTESLLQLPGKSNCMNWILGHIVVYRDGMLAGISQPPFLPDSQIKLYAARSQPITPDSHSVSFDRLLKLQFETFNSLIAWLESNPKGLRKKTPQDIKPRKGETVVEHFAQLLGHESIHIGELNPLRELVLINRSN